MRILLLLSLVFILSCKKDSPDPVKTQQSSVDTVALIHATSCAPAQLTYVVRLTDNSGVLIKDWSGTFEYDGSGTLANPKYFTIKLSGIPSSGNLCIQYSTTKNYLSDPDSYLSTPVCGQIKFSKASIAALDENAPDFYIPGVIDNSTSSYAVLYYAGQQYPNGDPCN